MVLCLHLDPIQVKVHSNVWPHTPFPSSLKNIFTQVKSPLKNQIRERCSIALSIEEEKLLEAKPILIATHNMIESLPASWPLF